MRKVADLCVKVGSYTDKEGKSRNRYLNVGSKMEGDKGAFLLLNRTFNPAGVPNPDNRDSIILSVFEVKQLEEIRSVTSSDLVVNPEDIKWEN